LIGWLNRNYDRALSLFQRALELNPRTGAPYIGMAHTYHVLGQLGDAIHNYHVALAIVPNDSFAQQMLVACLEEACGSGAIPLPE
jgi:tetratricopeptide (TPR) repeat protein